MKKSRVLVLLHRDLTPKEGISAPEVNPDWRMEWDVVTHLRGRGHELMLIEVHDDLTPIRQALDEFKPKIAFNLLEDFDGVVVFGGG
jgi:D-alanine-D-alanine ligase